MNRRGNLKLLTATIALGLGLTGAAFAQSKDTIKVGVLLLDGNEDGAGGLRAMNAAGGYAFAPAESGGGYTLTRGMVQQPVASDALVAGVMKMCSK